MRAPAVERLRDGLQRVQRGADDGGARVAGRHAQRLQHAAPRCAGAGTCARHAPMTIAIKACTCPEGLQYPVQARLSSCMKAPRMQNMRCLQYQTRAHGVRSGLWSQ